MNLPDELRARSFLGIDLPGGGFVDVPKATPVFQRWCGAEPTDTFSGKLVLDYHGRPVFAEEFTLRMLQGAGWTGVWVNSYRREYLASYQPRERVTLPTDRQEFLSRIAGGAAFPSGCWDVFAWHGGEVLLSECKRAKKDAICLSQRRWIERALAAGVTLDSFLIVEWTLRKS